jgi:hypothetical protein
MGGFSSLVRVMRGETPYTYGKYISQRDGAGDVTHVREYTWLELAKVMALAGFKPHVQSFNTYPADDQVWDHASNQPQPAHQWLWDVLPPTHQSMDKLGSNIFVIAVKGQAPHSRRPYQLYSYVRPNASLFDGVYPACKYEPIFCDNQLADKYFPTPSASAASSGGMDSGDGSSGQTDMELAEQLRAAAARVVVTAAGGT